VSAIALTYENDSHIINDYCTNKSEQAATAFVRKYQSFVYSIAIRYLQSELDAEDIAQEVFIKALNNLYKFRGDSSLKTWLYRITMNMCVNYKRKKKIISFFKHDEIEDVFVLKSNDRNPEEKFLDSEFENKFFKALNQLPEKQRETFSLRYFDQLSYEEISVMLGTTVGGLKANYFQAVKKLAVLMKEIDLKGV